MASCCSNLVIERERDERSREENIEHIQAYSLCYRAREQNRKYLQRG
jgi:hypothetical protein